MGSHWTIHMSAWDFLDLRNFPIVVVRTNLTISVILIALVEATVNHSLKQRLEN